MSREERDLINEKFTGVFGRLDSNFELLHQKLTAIEEQTKKTNGRVNALEEKTRLLELQNATHDSMCPQIPAIKKLQEDVNKVKTVKNFILGALAVIASASAIVYTFIKIFES